MKKIKIFCRNVSPSHLILTITLVMIVATVLILHIFFHKSGKLKMDQNLLNRVNLDVIAERYDHLFPLDGGYVILFDKEKSILHLAETIVMNDGKNKCLIDLYLFLQNKSLSHLPRETEWSAEWVLASDAWEVTDVGKGKYVEYVIISNSWISLGLTYYYTDIKTVLPLVEVLTEIIELTSVGEMGENSIPYPTVIPLPTYAPPVTAIPLPTCTPVPTFETGRAAFAQTLFPFPLHR